MTKGARLVCEVVLVVALLGLLIYLPSGCSLDGRGLGDVAADVDAGAGGAGGRDASSVDLVDAGAGGRDASSLDQVDLVDAGADCLGCWDGVVCVLPAQQNEDRCGAVGEPCGRTPLVCGGMGRGSCAAGEELGGRHACGELPGQSIIRPICCPANVCTYEACR